MRKKSILLPLVTLVIMLPTCPLIKPQSPPSADPIATAVAATLAAQSGGEPQAPTTAAPPTLSPPTAASPPPTSPPPSLPHIVYTDGGNVWQITGTNPPQQLTEGGHAVEVKISRDGMKVAFVVYDSMANQYQLRSVNIDGSGELVLLNQAQLDALHPLSGALHIAPYRLEFVPGSQDLLMTTQGLFDGPGLALYEDLLAIDSDTGAVATLLPPEQGGVFTISPDGSQIAFTRPTSLSLINAAGADLRSQLVTFPSITTYSEFLYHPPPVWSPDSTALGIAIPSEDPLAPATSGAIWRIPAHGNSPTLLATIPGDFYFPQLNAGPLISPDLARVAFLRQTGSPNSYQLYHANADGTGEVLYATGDISWVGWAPDSSHFVYALGSTNLQLGRVGYPPTPLASGTDLRWITDTRYLYLSGSYGAWKLMQGELGSGSALLTSPAGDFVSYDFN